MALKSPQAGLSGPSSTGGPVVRTPPSPPSRDLTRERFDLEEMGPGREREAAFYRLVTEWAQRDGAAALQYDLQWTNLNESDQGVRRALQVWSQQDFSQAWQWLTENGSLAAESQSRFWYGAALRSLAAHDPDRALRLAAESSSLLGNQALLLDIATALHINDQGRVTAFLAGLPDSPARQTAVQGVLHQWARHHPTEALRWAQGLDDVNARQQGVLAVVDTWARGSPLEAAQWASAQADPTLRSQALQRAINQWLQYDVEGAADWLARQPVGPETDPAAQALAIRLAREDPGYAMEWADSLGDPGLRSRTRRQIANQWKQSDPGGYAAFFQSSSLPSEIRSQLPSP